MEDIQDQMAPAIYSITPHNLAHVCSLQDVVSWLRPSALLRGCYLVFAPCKCGQKILRARINEYFVTLAFMGPIHSQLRRKIIMAMLECSARVWLFHLKHLQGERGKLSLNITREVCEYLAGTQLLVHVTPTFLCFFNFHTSAWGPQVPLSHEIQADGSSSWVMLEGSVFCCGGFATAAAYILARDGAVEQVANMSVMRAFHGLQTACNAAYVFGGSSIEASKTCEKWEVATSKWRNLPSMKGVRWWFNPCLLEGRMYICGYPAASMEVFVPQTDTFLPLLIPLPGNYTYCVYVDNHLLVVHSDTYILKFAVEPDGLLVQRSQVRSPQIQKWQNSQTVVDKANGVFYIVQDGKCICIDMETGVSGLTVALT